MGSLRVIFDLDTWQEIFGSISNNKTRTAITIVGVLWGVFIYIALSGSAKGLDNGFERMFQDIAMNSMFVWAQSTSIPYEGFKIGRPIELKISDVEYLRRQIPEIQFIAPRHNRGIFGTSAATVKRNNQSNNYNIYGDFPEFTKIATKRIFENGRFINDQDIINARKVAVIGEQTAEELFEKGEDPIGEYIQIDNIYFQVIGVHKFVPGGGFEQAGDIFIPFETFRKIYNTGDSVGWFSIAAYDDVDVVKVEEAILYALKRKHRVSPDDNRAFGSFNLGEAFNQIMGFANGMTFISLIVGIATLLAGVIGIGNISLISVKERTKEIGIRRAIGATPGEVKVQIIIENVFLTLIAGALGVVMGAGVLAIINLVTQNLEDFPYTNPTVPLIYLFGVVVLMVLLSTLIGLIPAQRAVSIRPIDALREE
ncbi:MAG: ABC transporter permease [Flavobacteriaceae bacterium]|nr:ABC transporter permease [Flavobacteriaceae bacterium]MCY4217303.1 ABC transporter permease [Flavobacteriaceae bacterium]MCY4254215.1 ABC transporter permease [Flavobacteriaceae bacterium]